MPLLIDGKIRLRWIRRNRGLWSACTAAAFILATLSACSGSNDPQDAAARPPRAGRSVPVVAIPAKLETLDETVSAVGTARALHSVMVFPESSGIVTAVKFEADARVNKGEVLLELDTRDEQLAVELARVELADAKRLAQRYTSINQTNTNIAQSQIDSARAAVESAEIALAQAEVALTRRRITAPFAGRVGITDIDVGDRVDTDTRVTTLDDRSRLLVNFTVPEIFVGQVVPGTEVDVQLWNSGRAPFSGRVVAVDSRIDATSRAFTARAEIDNASDRFRPGMAFEISVNVSRGEFIAVPDVAVQWGADGPYIWIAQDGVAERRDVALVKRLPNQLLVHADIPLGTPVISEGVQAVREGVTLRMLDRTLLDQDARLGLSPSGSALEDNPNGG